MMNTTTEMLHSEYMTLISRHGNLHQKILDAIRKTHFVATYNPSNQMWSYGGEIPYETLNDLINTAVTERFPDEHPGSLVARFIELAMCYVKPNSNSGPALSWMPDWKEFLRANPSCGRPAKNFEDVLWSSSWAKGTPATISSEYFRGE